MPKKHKRVATELIESEDETKQCSLLPNSVIGRQQTKVTLLKKAQGPATAKRTTNIKGQDKKINVKLEQLSVTQKQQWKIGFSKSMEKITNTKRLFSLGRQGIRQIVLEDCPIKLATKIWVTILVMAARTPSILPIYTYRELIILANILKDINLQGPLSEEIFAEVLDKVYSWWNSRTIMNKFDAKKLPEDIEQMARLASRNAPVTGQLKTLFVPGASVGQILMCWLEMFIKKEAKDILSVFNSVKIKKCPDNPHRIFYEEGDFMLTIQPLFLSQEFYETYKVLWFEDDGKLKDLQEEASIKSIGRQFGEDVDLVYVEDPHPTTSTQVKIFLPFSIKDRDDVLKQFFDVQFTDDENNFVKKTERENRNTLDFQRIKSSCSFAMGYAHFRRETEPEDPNQEYNQHFKIADRNVPIKDVDPKILLNLDDILGA